MSDSAALGSAARPVLLLQLLPGRVAGVQVVPILDVVLVLFPAEKHFAAAEDGGEIDEAALGILDLNLALVELEQQFLESHQAPEPLVDGVAAQVRAGGKLASNALVVTDDALEGAVEFGQPLADLRQQRARLLESVVLLEPHGSARGLAGRGHGVELALDLVARLDGVGPLPGFAGLLLFLERGKDVAQVIEERGVGFLGVFDGLLDPLERGLRLVEPEKHPAKAVEERRVTRLELHGLLDHLVGLLQIFPALGPHVAQIVQRLGEVRRQFQALAEIGFGFLELVVPLVSGAKLKEKSMSQQVGVFGAGDNLGGGEEFERIRVILHPRTGDGRVEFAEKRLRKALAGLVEGFESRLGFIGVYLRQSQFVEVDGFGARGQPEGILEIPKCFLRLPVLPQQLAQYEVNLRVSWVLTRQDAEVFDGVGAVLGEHQHLDQLLAQSRHLRQLLDQRGENLRRPFRRAKLEEPHGHSPEEPWARRLQRGGAFERLERASLYLVRPARTLGQRSVGFSQLDEVGGIGLGLPGRLVEHVHGLVRLLVLDVKAHQVPVTGELLGVLLDGFAIGLDGQVALADHRVRKAKPGVNGATGPGARRGIGEQFDGSIRLLQLQQQPRTDFDREGVVGQIRHRRIEKLVGGLFRLVIQCKENRRGIMGVRGRPRVDGRGRIIIRRARLRAFGGLGGGRSPVRSRRDGAPGQAKHDSPQDRADLNAQQHETGYSRTSPAQQSGMASGAETFRLGPLPAFEAEGPSCTRRLATPRSQQPRRAAGWKIPPARQTYFCQVRFLWRWARSFLRRLCLLIFALRRFFSEPISIRDWSDGAMEEWGVGVLECWEPTLGPEFHHSIAPLLHYSITPTPIQFSVGQYTTLLRGYSMIPSAPAALSRGMSSRTTCSSIIVSTATQPAWLRLEIVGRRNAGRLSSRDARFRCSRFILRPTFASASRAPLSIRAIVSILRRFHGFFQER